jgi:hypothetical protein
MFNNYLDIGWCANKCLIQYQGGGKPFMVLLVGIEYPATIESLNIKYAFNFDFPLKKVSR